MIEVSERYQLEVNLSFSDRVYDEFGFEGDYVIRPAPSTLIELILERASDQSDDQSARTQEVVARAYTDLTGQAQLTWELTPMTRGELQAEVNRDVESSLESGLDKNSGPQVWIRVRPEQVTDVGFRARVESRSPRDEYTLESEPVSLSELSVDLERVTLIAEPESVMSLSLIHI